MTSEQESVESMSEQTAIAVKITLPTSGATSDDCLEFLVFPSTTIQEIRQVVFDSQKHFYTCFALFKNGVKLNELSILSEALNEGENEIVLDLVQDVYNPHEVRVQLTRLRELMNGFEKPMVNSLGLNSSVSLLSTLMPSTVNESEDKTIEMETLVHEFEKSSTTVSSLFKFGSSTSDKYPKCLEELTLSSWNPPPFQRRLQGDIMYLSVTTLEGTTFEITASVSGFYVNSCTSSTFNPSVNKNKRDEIEMSSTLPDLLSKISPLFLEKLNQILEVIGNTTPHEYILPAVPVYPWAVPIVSSDNHKKDSGRLIDALLSASDALDTLTSRDWNEDLTGTSELPVDSASDRVQRDVAFARAYNDFLEASTKASLAVVNKEILPIGMNPAPAGESNKNEAVETDMSDMYIHNNLFLSKGYDSREVFDPYGGEEAAHVAVSKDIDGIRWVQSLDLDSSEEAVNTLGTAVVDFMGRRTVAQTIVPGILRRNEGESIVQYGSMDSGKTIASDQKFTSLMEKLAPHLYTKSHTVLDANAQEHTLVTSVDVKGILGTDGRKYLLDLYRLFPVDFGFLEDVKTEVQDGKKEGSEDVPYPHEMTLFRAELLELFYHHKSSIALQEYEKRLNAWKEANHVDDNGEASKEEANAKKDGEAKKDEHDFELVSSLVGKPKPEFKFDLAFNPDLFTRVNLTASESSDSTADEALAREASQFIKALILKMLSDFVQYPSNTPLDGAGLTKAFHSRGVNMRYLGYVVKTLETEGLGNVGCLKYLRNLCVQEMIARSAKHILRKHLASTELFMAGSCISHFLNCLFMPTSSTLKPDLSSVHASKASCSWASLTPGSLQQQIKSEVLRRFRYSFRGESLDDFLPAARRLTLLRSICLMIGIQISTRDFCLSSSTSPIFSSNDILNIYPIIKTAYPRAQFAEQAQEHGKLALAQGNKQVGLELLRESVAIFEQVLGAVHSKTGRAYAQLAMVLFREGMSLDATMDKETVNEDGNKDIKENKKEIEEKVKAFIDEACEYQKRAVIVSERANGIDDAETLQQYMNLAYFESMADRPEIGLRYALHSLKYWNLLSAGEPHPDTASALSNIASMLQKLRLLPLAQTFFLRACEINVSLFGEEHPLTAVSYDTLTKCYFVSGEFRKAVDTQKKVYDFAKRVFGADDQRAKDHFASLSTLTSLAVQSAKKERSSSNGVSPATQTSTSTRGKQASRPIGPSSSVTDPTFGVKGNLPLDDLLTFLGEKSKSSGTKSTATAVETKAGKKKNGKNVGRNRK